jgi:hypothetical protein
MAVAMRARPAAARRARRPALFGALALLALLWLVAAAPAPAQPAAEFVPAEETPEQYPEHAGREETFYACTACHGFRLVAQQGQSRRQWDETLDWMQTRHGMPPIEGAERQLVLDYLEASFPPRTAPADRGGWRNPFSQR